MKAIIKIYGHWYNIYIIIRLMAISRQIGQWLIGIIHKLLLYYNVLYVYKSKFPLEYVQAVSTLSSLVLCIMVHVVLIIGYCTVAVYQQYYLIVVVR